MLARLSPQEVALLTSLHDTAMEFGDGSDVPLEYVVAESSDVDWLEVYLANFVALGICRSGGPIELSTDDLERLSSGARFNEIARPKGGYRKWNEQVELRTTQRTFFTRLGLLFLDACAPLRGSETDANRSKVAPETREDA
jgi:hypothetical protein